MFSSEQYRCKASEYAKLSGMANGANEVREFERLERSFAEKFLTDFNTAAGHMANAGDCGTGLGAGRRALSRRPGQAEI